MQTATVPKAVEEQGRRAEELMAGIGKTATPAPAAAAAPAPNAAAIAAAAKAKEDEEAAAAAAAAAAASDPVQQQIAKLQADLAAALKAAEANQHKYDVLAGKYNHELSTALAQIAALQQQVKPAAPAASPEEQTKIDAAFQTFKEEMSPEAFTGLTQYIAEEAKRQAKMMLENVNASTTQQTFDTQLSSKVPDWREVNVDPGFKEWLATGTGYNITASLIAAYQEQNLDGTVKIFNDYKTFKAPKTAAAAPAPAAPAKGSEFLAPAASSASGAAPIPAVSEPITRLFIQNFYRDANAGVYRGRQAEHDAIEARIALALKNHEVTH